MKEKLLFIGGVADGERIDVPGDMSSFRVRFTPPVPVSTDRAAISKSVEYKDVLYKKMPLRGEKKTIFVMAKSGLSADAVLLSSMEGNKCT